MVAPAAPAAAGPLSLEATTVAVLVALSAMDGRPLPSSKRMLMFVLTDAQNSGMTFADAERTQLKSLGKLPVQILSVAITFQMALVPRLENFGAGLNGERREQVPLKATPDGWSTDIRHAQCGPDHLLRTRRRMSVQISALALSKSMRLRTVACWSFRGTFTRSKSTYAAPGAEGLRRHKWANYGYSRARLERYSANCRCHCFAQPASVFARRFLPGNHFDLVLVFKGRGLSRPPR